MYTYDDPLLCQPEYSLCALLIIKTRPMDKIICNAIQHKAFYYNVKSMHLINTILLGLLKRPALWMIFPFTNCKHMISMIMIMMMTMLCQVLFLKQ